MIKQRRKEMSKSTKIILAIVVVVALILIFDPFGGSDIEGEWEMTGGKNHTTGESVVTSEEDEYVMVFNDDGTGEISARGAGLPKEFEYSYEDGELIIDGDACECEIDGDIMTITVEINDRLLRRTNEVTMTFERR